MRIIEAIEIHLQQSDIENWYAHPRRKLKRSAGVHLSGVLKVMAVEFNLLKDIPEEDFEEKLPLRMALGQSWEYFAAGLYPLMDYQPGQVERDGIFGSPDGAWMEVPENKKGQRLGVRSYQGPEEFKRTRKSCRDFDLFANKNKLWIWQIMGYCCMDKRRPKRARLHPLFVEGDYVRGQYGFEERYWRYIVEFDQPELDKFWAMVLKFRDKAVKEVGSV